MPVALLTSMSAEIRQLMSGDTFVETGIVMFIA